VSIFRTHLNCGIDLLPLRNRSTYSPPVTPTPLSPMDMKSENDSRLALYTRGSSPDAKLSGLNTRYAVGRGCGVRFPIRLEGPCAVLGNLETTGLVCEQCVYPVIRCSFQTNDSTKGSQPAPSPKNLWVFRPHSHPGSGLSMCGSQIRTPFVFCRSPMLYDCLPLEVIRCARIISMGKKPAVYPTLRAL